MHMRRTVLLVDDDPEVVRTFADWLGLQGYDVRTAADGEAAWPQVRGVDAIILDARMPISWWNMQNTYLQFNVFNLTNTRQPFRTSSVTNANAVVLTPAYTKPAVSYFYYYDAPRTLSVTLHAQF